MNNIQSFASREILDPLCTDLWRIEAGMVRATTWLCDGSLTTLGFWGAGDTISNALFPVDRRPESVQPSDYAYIHHQKSPY